jgi:hypothetical protein
MCVAGFKYFIYYTLVRRCLLFNMLGMMFLEIICILAGLLIFAKYYNCDPVSLDAGVRN